MPEHDKIEDPYIHEPKDISGANAGEVYIADGAGKGSWQPNSVAVVPRGETVISSNGGIVIAVGGGAGDIRDDGSYTAITQLYTPELSLSQDVTYDGVTGELIIGKDGIYSGAIWLSFSDSIGNQIMAFKSSKNGAYGSATNPVFHDRTKTGGEVINISGGSLFSAVAGDKIGLGVAATNSGNLTIFDSTLSLFRIQEL